MGPVEVRSRAQRTRGWRTEDSLEELALLAGMIREACGQKAALDVDAAEAQADFEKTGAGESCLSAGVRSAGNVAGTQTEAAADLVAAVRACEQTEKHADWIEELAGRHDFAAEDPEEVLRDEVGAVFAKVLEHAGVYKRTPEGRAAFLRFVDTVNAKKT